ILNRLQSRDLLIQISVNHLIALPQQFGTFLSTLKIVVLLFYLRDTIQHYLLLSNLLDLPLVLLPSIETSYNKIYYVFSNDIDWLSWNTNQYYSHYTKFQNCSPQSQPSSNFHFLQ